MSKELDEILFEAIEASASYTHKVTAEEADYIQAKAKQAIQVLIDKEVAKVNSPTHIMGKPIDEVCGILSMLDMERLAEMQLTMANLKKWQKLLAEEQRKTFEKALANQLERLKDE